MNRSGAVTRYRSAAKVRRMLAGVGHPVKRLTRVAMGPIALKGVAVGQWRELDRNEVRRLRRAVGLEGKRAGRARGSGGERGNKPTGGPGGGGGAS